MTTTADFEIFLVAVPGLETALCAEARKKGFASASAVPGGVAFRGGWPDVWRANLDLRGASRILARFASFRAFHLAQLDKRSRKVAWSTILRPDVPVRVEASCRVSKIYHSGAAAERIARAIHEELGAPISEVAEVVIKARIEDDLVTLAVDTSGEPLHKRGFKEAVAKAPMRETLAALFLQECGYRGTEPVLDPMCGSGTFVIEAAEIAAEMKPGRARAFAFERLATFDAKAWRALRGSGKIATPAIRFHGSDRDAGAIRMAKENAERAGVAAFCTFEQRDISDLASPEGPPGLVIVNPPYGGRIGEARKLQGLYRKLGDVLTSRFSGWRVGLITSEPSLAKATGLAFEPPGVPVLHGGIRIGVYRGRMG